MRETVRTTRRRASFVGRHFMALGVGVLVVVLLLALAGCRTATPSTASARAATTSTTPTAASTSTKVTSTTHVSDGLATVGYADLPTQAQRTVRLIDAGGPYPYRKDGAVFANRERLLPRKATGYYHEYTVVTPGSGDRGARRIVQGRDGTMYYSDDHYRSFRRIVR